MDDHRELMRSGKLPKVLADKDAWHDNVGQLEVLESRQNKKALESTDEYDKKSRFPQKEMRRTRVHRLGGTEIHTPPGAASPFRSPCGGSFRELGWEEV